MADLIETITCGQCGVPSQVTPPQVPARARVTITGNDPNGGVLLDVSYIIGPEELVGIGTPVGVMEQKLAAMMPRADSSAETRAAVAAQGGGTGP